MEEYNKKIIVIILLAIAFVVFIVFLLLLLTGTTNKGTLSVTSSPSEATVLVDNKELGKTPITTGELKTGKHTVLVKKEGLSNATEIVDVKKGGNRVSLTLSPSTVSGKVFKNKLLILNTKFEIRQSGQNSYVVALKAVYNRPGQYTAYLEQLKVFKKEALDWLRTNKIDPAKAQIEYVPKEAKDL